MCAWRPIRSPKPRLSRLVHGFAATLGKVVIFFFFFVFVCVCVFFCVGVPHLIVVKFSEVSEELTAYNLWVTQLFQVDAEEKRRIDMRRLYRMV